jgi:putative NADH-flavin reductase
VAPDTLEKAFGGKHEPYPLPDHIAQTFDGKDGYTVHTGYFGMEGGGAEKAFAAPAEKEAAAAGARGGGLKKSMSSTRLAKVRQMLARFDTMGRSKGVPTANEVPKTSPRITVFGATGRTGMQVVGLALKAGYDVCAFVRIDGKGVPPALLAMGREFGEDKLQVVVGDVTNANDLDRAIETSDAVVSCMGAPPALASGANEFYETTGTKIVEALERNGTKRFVVVTAAQAKRMSQAWWDKNASLAENLSRPMYWAGTYKHLAALEKYIEERKDQVDYTFVRPSQLDDSATSDKYKLESGSFFVGGGPLPRPALAAFIVQECIVANKHVGTGVALAAVD